MIDPRLIQLEQLPQPLLDMSDIGRVQQLPGEQHIESGFAHQRISGISGA
jgi:hypothetical protein